MKIAEIFESIQGEGPEVGMRCTFVRLAGCNLNCPWCDTENRNVVHLEMPPRIVASRIKTPNVVITGGEPMLQKDEVYEFANNFMGHVSIETNGTIDFRPSEFNTVVVSPKRYEELKFWVKKMEKYRNVFLKIVIHDNHTWGLNQSLESLLNTIPDSPRVYFMPAGVNYVQIANASRHVIALLKQFRQIRYSPRLQILLGWR